ncbi:tetratricopeptide repeat protein [Ignavibacterium sp.]|uniref:tetratricopeptide repeat protein n=1 Tax=Ignavibacterium sp. TaxID=2651167 RepID=UPI00307F070B
MSIKSLFQKYTFYSLSLIIVFILSLLFLQVPLIGTFGYEYSALFAFIFFLVSGLLNIHRIKKQIPLKTFLYFLVSVLILPVLTVIFYSLFKDVCSFWFGITFYLVLAVISFIIGILLSEIVNFIFSKFTKAIYLIVVLLICLIPLIEIYFNPQIYFYSPIIVFFPGTIYDEDITINSTILIYRLLNLAYFTFLFLLFKKAIIKNKIIFSSLAIVIAVLLILLSPNFGFSTTHSQLDSVLSAKTESKNFIIKYDDSVIDSAEIKIILLAHEYYFEKINSALKFTPEKKITSYIFNDGLQKKKYFGSEFADVAKPWLYEIYLSKYSWSNSLKHELLHVFSSEFGSGIFKLSGSFNPALIEGFAEAIDNNFDDLDIHSVAASAYHFNYNINILELFSGLNFFRTFSGLAYLYSGSFVKYLIDKYGLKAFVVFYKTNDAEKAFSKELSELANEYYVFLENQRVNLTKQQVEFYFGRASIFQKMCPRQVATKLKDAESLIEQKNYPQAEQYLLEILKTTPNYQAISGLTKIYFEEKNFNKALDLINKYISQFEKTPYYFNLKLLTGDFLLLSSDTINAFKFYNDLIKSNPNLRLKLLSKLRIELNEFGELRNYLKSNDSTKFEILIRLNQNKTVFCSILSMINLAVKLEIEPYRLIDSFHSKLTPTNDDDAFIVYKLSEYLLNKSELNNARKLAALSIRKSFNPIYYISIKEHFEKCNWFVKHYDQF